MRVDGGDVNVSIVAHSPEGHLAISGHLDELRQVLATSGGDVQLSLADGGGKGEAAPGGGRYHRRRRLRGDRHDRSYPGAGAMAGKSLHIIL